MRLLLVIYVGKEADFLASQVNLMSEVPKPLKITRAGAVAGRLAGRGFARERGGIRPSRVERMGPAYPGEGSTFPNWK
jgi:hypothetical protein